MERELHPICNDSLDCNSYAVRSKALERYFLSLVKLSFVWLMMYVATKQYLQLMMITAFWISHFYKILAGDLLSIESVSYYVFSRFPIRREILLLTYRSKISTIGDSHRGEQQINGHDHMEREVPRFPACRSIFSGMAKPLYKDHHGATNSPNQSHDGSLTTILPNFELKLLHANTPQATSADSVDEIIPCCEDSILAIREFNC